MTDVSRPLLILDLDETLVHATKSPLEIEPDFSVGPFVVYRRPHLSEFMDHCFTLYDVAVWTSASRDYADEIVTEVFQERLPSFLWCSDRCTQRTNHETQERYTVKDLRKVIRLGYDLERVLMVDDSPEKLERNYGNHIWITPFEGDQSDTELPRLAHYLTVIRDTPNFRRLEKRHWRHQVPKAHNKPIKGEQD